MHLWIIHPYHLDPKRIKWLWRDGICAQTILHELENGNDICKRKLKTIDKFMRVKRPREAISYYLQELRTYAHTGNYCYRIRFSKKKIMRCRHRREIIPISEIELIKDIMLAEKKNLITSHNREFRKMNSMFRIQL